MGLDNIVAIVDENGLQIDGACSDVMCLGDIARKFAAFGWETFEVDGHDVDALHETLVAARAHTGAPAVVVARTVKGKGVSFMEGDAGWHGKAPSAEETERAVAELTASTERSDS
jgi:transketolase